MKRPEVGFVLLMSLLSVLGLLGTDICAPSLPIIASALNVTQGAAQGLISAFLLGIAASQLLAGPLSDRFRRRPVCFVALAVCCCPSVPLCFAESLPLMCVLRFVQALGAGAGMTLARAVVADRFTGAEMAVVLALVSPVAGASPALAPVLGAHLTTWLGWRSTFAFLAIAAMLIGLLAAHRLQETLPPERRILLRPGSVWRSYVSLLKKPIFIGYCVMTCAVDSAYFSYVSQTPFLLDGAGASVRFVGGCYSAVAITYIVATFWPRA